MKRLALAMFAATALAGCATAPMAMAQPPIMEPHMMPPASAIQPETTINLTGIGKVDLPNWATLATIVLVLWTAGLFSWLRPPAAAAAEPAAGE
jgi:hypothetical protein